MSITRLAVLAAALTGAGVMSGCIVHAHGHTRSRPAHGTTTPTTVYNKTTRPHNAPHREPGEIDVHAHVEGGEAEPENFGSHDHADETPPSTRRPGPPDHAKAYGWRRKYDESPSSDPDPTPDHDPPGHDDDGKGNDKGKGKDTGRGKSKKKDE